MKEQLTLFRKRLIPDECVELKDDIILEQSDEIIVTKWNTLKPKRELHHGFSCYYLTLGFKVSMFCREDHSLMYWYCDIVDYSYIEETNALTIMDLLADVVVYPDGYSRILDLDELALAAERKLCEKEVIITALRNLDRLLHLIYEDKFDTLTAPIRRWDC